MPGFRATVRFGERGADYDVVDVDADGLADALRRVADALSDAADASGDLIEIRRRRGPDDRHYVGE